MKVHPVLKYILKLLALGVIYRLGVVIGLSMAFVQSNTSPVWPPTGIAIAALLLFGWQLWPAITMAVLLGSLLTGAPATLAIGMANGNTLEALPGIPRTRRYTKYRPTEKPCGGMRQKIPARRIRSNTNSNQACSRGWGSIIRFYSKNILKRIRVGWSLVVGDDTVNNVCGGFGVFQDFGRRVFVFVMKRKKRIAPVKFQCIPGAGIRRNEGRPKREKSITTETPARNLHGFKKKIVGTSLVRTRRRSGWEQVPEERAAAGW